MLGETQLASETRFGVATEPVASMMAATEADAATSDAGSSGYAGFIGDPIFR